MAIRRKLTLINGTMGTEGDISLYRAMNNLEIGGCPPGVLAVPPLPFPDDDWDDFDPADEQDR